MDTVDILKAARAKIEQGWTRNDLAKDGSRRAANPCSPYAVRWCSVGAIVSVASSINEEKHARNALTAAIGTTMIGDWNDSRKSKAPVLAAFDKAIAAEQAEQGEDGK